jgi:acetoin:2,6-dichlorophenolindophenol oxidoreductase subunit alpha
LVENVTDAAVRIDQQSTDKERGLPSQEELRHMYLTMERISGCNRTAVKEISSGRLQAAFYPVHGLEGVAGALSIVLNRSDYLVSTYRNLADCVAKGVSLRSIVAEVNGRTGGTSKGKGGPMHLTDTDNGLMVTTGIVGSGLPIAVGLALAAQLDQRGNATLVTFGDGATSIGATHEALNLAALWNLPLVFLCQNNQWGEHTPIREYAANTDLAARAAAYGMSATSVDGFDPIATWATLQSAVDKARAGGGPTFVEAITYRLTGHSGVADASYMPADELQAAMERDPAPTFRRWLAREGLLGETELDAIAEQAKRDVEDAFDYAQASPLPGADELYTDVFGDPRQIPGR